MNSEFVGRVGPVREAQWVRVVGLIASQDTYRNQAMNS